MTNDDIMTGISTALYNTYGDGVKIYGDEDIKQGLETPAFFIALLTSTQKQHNDSRWFRTHTFDVHYFPKSEGNNLELNGVGAQLFDVLQYITLLNGDLLRATGMSYEVVDGVLHFTVNYDVFLVRYPEPNWMETLTIEEGTT